MESGFREVPSGAALLTGLISTFQGLVLTPHLFLSNMIEHLRCVENYARCYEIFFEKELTVIIYSTRHLFHARQVLSNFTDYLKSSPPAR